MEPLTERDKPNQHFFAQYNNDNSNQSTDAGPAPPPLNTSYTVCY